jgi:hypothetical protein
LKIEILLSSKYILQNNIKFRRKIMNSTTSIGITILLIGLCFFIVGLIFPFICLMGILMMVVGFVLTIVGIAQGDQPQYPQYPPYYPPQYPPQYPQQYPPGYQPPPQPPPLPTQPKRMCPSCGREIDFNAVACPYCGKNFS